MDCPSCATKIENAILRIPGVTDVQVSVASGRVAIEHDAAIKQEVHGRGRYIDPSDCAAALSRSRNWATHVAFLAPEINLKVLVPLRRERGLAGSDER